MEPHIALSGEHIFDLGLLPVTNSLFTTWVVMALLFILGLSVKSSLARIPGRFQMGVELVVGGIYDMFHSILGKRTRKFFPLLGSLFLFIIVSNWFGLLPGVGTIGIKEVHERSYEAASPAMESASAYGEEHEMVDPHAVAVTEDHATDGDHGAKEEHHGPFDIPLLRAPTADLNTTLALSLISMVMLQYWGMQALGSLSYLSKFITFKDFISFYIGILELISEVSKVISFAFRLFGNIFAGEVLLVIVGSLVPLILPLPFIGLEIFVGMIQALVFSMLLAVFLSIATEAHH